MGVYILGTRAKIDVRQRADDFAVLMPASLHPRSSMEELQMYALSQIAP